MSTRRRGPYRHRCPYCRRAFKHAGSLQRHKAEQSFPGACWAGTPQPAAAGRRGG